MYHPFNGCHRVIFKVLIHVVTSAHRHTLTDSRGGSDSYFAGVQKMFNPDFYVRTIGGKKIEGQIKMEESRREMDGGEERQSEAQ